MASQNLSMSVVDMVRSTLNISVLLSSSSTSSFVIIIAKIQNFLGSVQNIHQVLLHFAVDIAIAGERAGTVGMAGE